MKSPTAHWWQYPTAHPSPRFNTTNQLVRELDSQYVSLPPELQEAWEELSKIWGWSADCFEAVFGVNPLTSEVVSPKEIFIAVNCNRWVQGLGFVDAPPVIFTSPGDDFAVLNLPFDFSFTWARYDGAPSLPSYCTVSVCGLNHEPESGPALSRYSLALAGPISYSVPFDLNPLYSLRPGVMAMPFVSLAVRVMDQGSAPFFGQRLGFVPP